MRKDRDVEKNRNALAELSKRTKINSGAMDNQSTRTEFKNRRCNLLSRRVSPRDALKLRFREVLRFGKAYARELTCPVMHPRNSMPLSRYLSWQSTSRSSRNQYLYHCKCYEHKPQHTHPWMAKKAPLTTAWKVLSYTRYFWSRWVNLRTAVKSFHGCPATAGGPSESIELRENRTPHVTKINNIKKWERIEEVVCYVTKHRASTSGPCLLHSVFRVACPSPPGVVRWFRHVCVRGMVGRSTKNISEREWHAQI